MKRAFVFATLALSTIASAGDLHGVVTVGGDFGGDTLLTIVYTDGTTSSLKAGQGFLLSGGIVYNFDEIWSLQSTAGIKYQQTQDSTNENTSFMRYPIEALAFFHFKGAPVRVGAGLAYHIAPTVSATGSLANGTINFNSALGYLVEADLLLADKFIVGVRYTAMRYKTSSLSVDGSSIGFQLGWIF